MTVAHSILLLSVVIASGKILGNFKLCGISIGVAWILFAGLLFAHFGYCPDVSVLRFVKELGLVFFVYSIGLQAGPGFFAHFRTGGLRFNLLAGITVLLGICTTCVLASVSGVPLPIMVGVMSGAVTNTPGLGAAQQAYASAVSDSSGVIGEAGLATGYAVAYPLGMVGCILSIVFVRKILYRNAAEMDHAGTARCRTVCDTQDLARAVPLKGQRRDEPDILPIFLGIALGCWVGMRPIPLPGISQPVRLGLAGGPLIVSILMSAFGPRIKMSTYTAPGANLMIREVGISLFLACVGLESGGDFVSALTSRGGAVLVACGALITLLPLLVCAGIGRFFLAMDGASLCGVLAGAMTNPPALAYAAKQERSDAVTLGYATVYPLAMFLRILAAQLLVALRVG